MFEARRRVAWGSAILAALAAGGAAGVGVAPIEPSLEIDVSQLGSTADRQMFDVRALPRGGETIATVRLEVVSGDVRCRGRTQFLGLLPTVAARFELRVPRDDPRPAVVRIHQGGRVTRTYDVTLPVDRP